MIRIISSPEKNPLKLLPLFFCASLLAFGLACSSNKPATEPSSTSAVPTENLEVKPLPLEGTKWELVELLGSPVIAAQGRGPYTLELNGSTQRAAAFAGCNRLNAGYTRKDVSRLEFSPVASTMMACLDMSVETQLAEVMERVDSFVIVGDELQLLRAKMAPLARFKAMSAK
jgi:heat shock protein HslJ